MEKDALVEAVYQCMDKEGIDDTRNAIIDGVRKYMYSLPNTVSGRADYRAAKKFVEKIEDMHIEFIEG